MTTPRVSIQQYERQQQIAGVTVAALLRLWAQAGTEFDFAYQQLRPRMVETIQLGRAASVHAAIPYTSEVLAETRQVGVPSGAIVPAAFLATAPNGLPVTATLDALPVKAKQAVGRGATALEARSAAGSWLSGIALTMLADTRRDVFQADIVSRPQVTGYVRMLNPPSCSRCVILAGKRFAWNQGFQRHPNCFPAGVVVSGPSPEGATRRWYEGELVTLTTASGEQLPATANHPILTSRGWVPANLIKEGDYVVRSTSGEGATPLVIPDHKQVPSLIEDVWSAFSVNGLDRMPTTAEDFHGDGQDGHVDVVYADGSLLDGVQAAFGEHVVQHGFASGVTLGLGLVGQSVSEFRDLWDAAESGSAVCGADLAFAFVGAEGAVSFDPSFTQPASFHAGSGESLGDSAARYPVLSREGVLARAGLVRADDFCVRERVLGSRWDAPSLPFLGEGGEGYASIGADLLKRLSGQVELDRVVHTVSRDFSGHVYNLTSSEGWFTANSLIVSNCDCMHIPASEQVAGDLTTDPYEYFRSLSEKDQDRLFGKWNAQGIRDGADIFQVVNTSQRAVPVAGSGGRMVQYAGRAKPTLAQIYASDKDRRFVAENMRYHGYITGPQNPMGNIRGNDPVGGILAAGRGQGTYTVGGQVVTTNRAARFDAVTSGVRDPLNRSTMTAAERRLYDAHYRAQWADAGYRPNSVGANSADRGLGLRPISVRDAAAARERLAREVSIASDAALTPDSVRELGRLLGLSL